MGAQVATVDALLLTDDEVAAAAVSMGLSWPTLLPTIPSDDENLVAAAVRGRRSLAVRGFLVPGPDRFGQLADEVSSVLGDDLGSGVICGVSVTDGQLRPVDGGPSFYFYGKSDSARWLTDVVGLDGIHRIAPATDDECRDVLVALVESVLAEGLVTDDRSSPSSTLCVTGSSRSNRAVLVGLGELRLTTVDADPGSRDVVATAVGMAESVAEALAWLGITA